MKRPFRQIGIAVIARFFVCVCIACFLASCSGTAPTLEEWKWRILYRDDGEHRYEELYGFFRASDPDGSADLASLTVLIESADLEWMFNSGEWTQAPDEENLWGLPPMIPHMGMSLPDGLYTVRVSDLAGRTDEITFRPLSDRPDPENIDWPEVTLDEGVIRLTGPFTSGDLILRGEKRAFLSRSEVFDGDVPDFTGALWWELWFGFDDSSGGGSSEAARADENAARGFRIGPFPTERGC